MVQAIGPFDGRKARKKRCDRCAERRIKCVGESPCLNCSRTNHPCHTATVRKTNTPVFVHTSQASFRTRKPSHVAIAAVALPARAPCVRNDYYVAYFFTCFLRQNAFTGIAPHFAPSISSLIHCSVELRSAIDAISALHITQRGHPKNSQGERFAALQAYSQSVKSVRAKIALKSFVCDPSSLWTTLWLGIFELMRDHTGTNWLAHFLHGTSTMLRLQGPSILTHENGSNEHRRTFFFSTRIFEISRALIYTEPTFLSTPEWSTAIEAHWKQNLETWTLKEALFDILPGFVDLSIRALRFLNGAQNAQRQEQNQSASSLGQEGLLLQTVLLQWHLDFLSWTSPGSENSEKLDAEMLIAQVYYHTISIYLDGIFSYHASFTASTAPACPVLDREVLDWHVNNILGLSQELLDRGTAGILLFFPLRVAGARARTFPTQAELLRLLHTIVQRGFSVALAFVEDLNNLWAEC